MKLYKLNLILTLIGILIISFLAQSKPIQTGTILSIQTSQYKTTIKLQNHEAELIIFDKVPLILKQGDQIKFQGKPDIYKNKKQIIIEKMSLIN
jgi:DNA/RNA endonuclease YhcR with UshA esterase domain